MSDQGLAHPTAEAPLRVLVTGGAGLIGSHLTGSLLGAGHHVVVVDDFSTSVVENLADLRGSPRLTVLERDIVDPLHLQVDQIYHLACPASPVHYQRDPVRTLRTCVLGASTVLDLAREVGATVLLASTSEVYGDPAVHPQVESYWGNVNPIGVRACYDEGKRCAEALFHSYEMQHGVDVKIVRIFNTYGPRMRPDDGRVIANFITRALRDAPLPVLGEGTQTRSFCFVEDLVDGLVKMMGTPREVSGPVNLGNPEEFSMLELAERVIDLVGSRSRVELGPLPPDDPTRRRPDVSLARDLLGWQPATPLATGLDLTVKYFREALA